MNYSGFVLLSRKITKSEIWDYDANTLKVFLYLIMEANITDKLWRGITIKRGQYVGSRAKLSLGTGLSEQNIRTCLKNLKEIGCITVESTNKITIVTVCKYDTYQPQFNKSNQPTNQPTNQQDNQPNSQPINQQNNQQDNQPINQLTNQPINHNYIINNTNIQDTQIQENNDTKNFFLKNGKAAEKKVFKIEEIKAALAAEGIYMTENGYIEFKALNEGESGYGYKGGIIRSAQNFLQKPMNQKYSLARENNGNGKGKGKNTPPTPPQPPQAAPIDPEAKKAAEEIWNKAKEIIREQMSIKDFNTWIKPIKPLNIEGQELTIQVPSSFFYEYIEENLIGIFTQVLNKQNINKLQYRVKV